MCTVRVRRFENSFPNWVFFGYVSSKQIVCNKQKVKEVLTRRKNSSDWNFCMSCRCSTRIVFTRIQLSLLFYEYWNFDLTIICFSQNKIRPTCHQKLCCGLKTFPSFYTLGKNTLKTVIYILLEFFAQKVKLGQN